MSGQYHFRNLVFEGGGVKGIAYVGALEMLRNRGILDQITRAGGTSAGAITATLVALRYSPEEVREVLYEMDFRSFLDSSVCDIEDIWRVIRKYGWYRGDTFSKWMSEIVARKTGNPNTTFGQLAAAGSFRELHLITTNLSTHDAEILSHEKTSEMPIAEGVRMSMSIPLFFAAVKKPLMPPVVESGTESRLVKYDIFVDGGVLDNYPVKLFDHKKYVMRFSKPTEYYQNLAAKKRLPGLTVENNPYVFNMETLGFRLDTKEEIAVFHGAPLTHRRINGIKDYLAQLVGTILDSQDNQHLHSDDWQRTIYIDTLGISTTQFDLGPDDKDNLVESGRQGVKNYFDWFDNPQMEVYNRPDES